MGVKEFAEEGEEEEKKEEECVDFEVGAQDDNDRYYALLDACFAIPPLVVLPLYETTR